LPPQFKALGLRPGGGFAIEVSFLCLPQAPDPRGRFGALAGPAPETEPALPALAGVNPSALLPQAVRQLPQLQHLRLGGLQPAASSRSSIQVSKKIGGSQRGPQLPSFPAMPATPAAAGAPPPPAPDLATHKSILSGHLGSSRRGVAHEHP
jgi:hypothetical protein